MNKIILTSDKEILNRDDIISVECELNDNVSHFDHHGVHGIIDKESESFKKDLEDPANRLWFFVRDCYNSNHYRRLARENAEFFAEKLSEYEKSPFMKIFKNNITQNNRDIIISHIDADVLLSINYLKARTEMVEYCDAQQVYPAVAEDIYNWTLNKKEMFEISQADIYGLHTIKKDNSYFFVAGIKKLIADLKVPRVTEKHVDVTEIITKILSYDFYEIVNIGKEEYKLTEEKLEKATIEIKNKTIFLNLSELSDVTTLYSDSIENIVVYRDNWKTISLYSSKNDIAGTHANVQFAGHPRACGSPRNEIMSLEIAKQIFEEISTL